MMDTYKLVISKQGSPYLQCQFTGDDEVQAIEHLREIISHFPTTDGFTHDLTMRREQWFSVDIST